MYKIITLIIIIILILSYYKIKIYIDKIYDKKEIIRILVRQMTRWSNAAIQDKSPLVGVLHANYGAGYLWALHDIATDDEITNTINFNSKVLTSIITKIQDTKTKEVINICPQYASYLNETLRKMSN